MTSNQSGSEKSICVSMILLKCDLPFLLKQQLRRECDQTEAWLYEIRGHLGQNKCF